MSVFRRPTMGGLRAMSPIRGNYAPSSVQGSVQTAPQNLYPGRISNDPLLQGATYGLPEGYTQRDSGRGTYEILDPTGKVVGTGYDDPHTTLTEWQRENILGSIKEGETPANEQMPWLKQGPSKHFYSPYLTENVQKMDEYGNPVYAGESGATEFEDKARQFQTREELEAELQKLLGSSSSIDDVYGRLDHSQPYPSYFSTPNRWEALGILANQSPDSIYKGAFGSGTYNPGASNHIYSAADFVGLPNTVRGNAIASPEIEELRGQHALYGSTPVFDKSNKLIGYKVDPRLMNTGEQKAVKDYFGQLDPSRSPYQVDDLGLATAWNRRSSATQNTLRRELNPGWDKFGKISQSEYFVPLDKVGEVPGWKNYSSASYDNWSDKTKGNLLKTIAPMALMFVPGMQGLAGTIGTALGASGAAATALGTGIMSGGLNLVGGGDLKSALKAGVLGGLGNYAGSYVGGLDALKGVNPIVVKALSGAAEGFIKSGLDPKAALAGGITGGLTQGIGGILPNDLKWLASPLARAGTSLATGRKINPLQLALSAGQSYLNTPTSPGTVRAGTTGGPRQAMIKGVK